MVIIDDVLEQKKGVDITYKKIDIYYLASAMSGTSFPI